MILANLKFETLKFTRIMSKKTDFIKNASVFSIPENERGIQKCMSEFAKMSKSEVVNLTA